MVGAKSRGKIVNTDGTLPNGREFIH